MTLLHYIVLFIIGYATFGYIKTRFFDTQGLQLSYMKDKKVNSQICKVIEESGLKTVKYTPYMFAWMVHLQALCFLPLS